jgi:hypothetical protein
MYTYRRGQKNLQSRKVGSRCMTITDPTRYAHWKYQLFIPAQWTHYKSLNIQIAIPDHIHPMSILSADHLCMFVDINPRPSVYKLHRVLKQGFIDVPTF